MTVKIIRYLTDDLIAAEDPAAPEVVADGTTRFAIDGRAWDIDLSGPSRKRLLDALEPFRKAGRPVRAPRGRRQKAERDRSVIIREWAREQGMKVSERGRIPAEVQARYEAQASPV